MGNNETYLSSIVINKLVISLGAARKAVWRDPRRSNSDPDPKLSQFRGQFFIIKSPIRLSFVKTFSPKSGSCKIIRIPVQILQKKCRTDVKIWREKNPKNVGLVTNTSTTNMLQHVEPFCSGIGTVLHCHIDVTEYS